MELKELKDLIEAQGTTFKEFKAANNEMQKQLETLGAADVVTEEKVTKLNAALDGFGAQIEALGKKSEDLETRLNRPGVLPGPENEDERKALAQFNLELKLHAQFRGKPAPAEFDMDGFRQYKQVYGDYLRKGVAETWGDTERKAMSVGSDPDGGYLVPSDSGGRIVTKIRETSEMRPIAAVQTISTDALRGINDLDEAGAGWVAETGARPATTTPGPDKWRIPVHEMYAMPEATQQLLDDAMVDVEGWLEGKVADKLVRLENTAFVTGDGTGKPRGFASYTTAATADASRAWGTLEHVATGTSGGFGTAPNGSDKLIDLVHKVKSAYRGGARWAMNRATVGEVRKLKANNEYIWLPSMVAGQPAQLLGYPVAEFEDLPDLAANSLSIAFGDFMIGYQIVDRQGIRVLRDPFTNKPYVRFYTTRRVGGAVLHFEAIKFMKFI